MSTFDTDGQDEGNSNEYMENIIAPQINQVESLTGEKQGTSIISASLLKQVEELINGAKLTLIENDTELTNAVELGKRARKIRQDLESDGKKVVEPLYKAYVEKRDYVSTKVDAIKSVESNIAKVASAYQVKKEREAREAREKAERDAAEKRRELALLEEQRIAEEEALRKEAEEKYSAGKIEEGNIANDCANIAIREAQQIEQQIHEVEAVPVAQVFRPKGFSAKMKLVATVNDYRVAMKYLVDNNEWGYLEGSAFRNLVDSAVKKIADRAENKDSFKVAGAVVREESAGRF
jgi:hypothetical protein